MFDYLFDVGFVFVQVFVFDVVEMVCQQFELFGQCLFDVVVVCVDQVDGFLYEYFVVQDYCVDVDECVDFVWGVVGQVGVQCFEFVMYDVECCVELFYFGVDLVGFDQVMGDVECCWCDQICLFDCDIL